MTIKTYKFLIILLRLDKWSYLFNSLFILFTLIFLKDNRFLIASLVVAHVLIRKIIVTYLKNGLDKKTSQIQNQN